MLENFFYFNLHLYNNSEGFHRPGLSTSATFDGLLGDSRYKESPSGMSRVLQLSLREVIKGPDVTTVEKDLICGPQVLDLSC